MTNHLNQINALERELRRRQTNRSKAIFIEPEKDGMSMRLRIEFDNKEYAQVIMNWRATPTEAADALASLSCQVRQIHQIKH